jgi:hypothetical protein
MNSYWEIQPYGDNFIVSWFDDNEEKIQFEAGSLQLADLYFELYEHFCTKEDGWKWLT